MPDVNETRRRFMTHFAGIGLGSTLAPGIIWARMQDAGAAKITVEMVADAMKLSGLQFSEAELKEMVTSANRNLTALRGDARDPHPERRVAAVPLQRDRAGHRREPDEAAVHAERGAGA